MSRLGKQKATKPRKQLRCFSLRGNRTGREGGHQNANVSTAWYAPGAGGWWQMVQSTLALIHGWLSQTPAACRGGEPLLRSAGCLDLDNLKKKGHPVIWILLMKDVMMGL